jgi:hypothetical protein
LVIAFILPLAFLQLLGCDLFDGQSVLLRSNVQALEGGRPTLKDNLQIVIGWRARSSSEPKCYISTFKIFAVTVGFAHSREDSSTHDSLDRMMLL